MLIIFIYDHNKSCDMPEAYHHIKQHTDADYTDVLHWLKSVIVILEITGKSMEANSRQCL